MALVACGISHKTAPIDIREKFAFSDSRMAVPLLDAVNDMGMQEVAILSTCNRTELYAYGAQVEDIKHWLAKKNGFTVSHLEPFFYSYKEQMVVRHIMMVAGGLDSMVLGEPQILGQLKSAYNLAYQTGTIGSELQRLFEFVFSTTKQLRSKTAIGSCPVSVAYAAVCLAKNIFSDLSKTKVLLIGAGSTIELVARYLHNEGVQQIMVANRHINRADNLAGKYGGQGLLMSQISDVLSSADIVISATSSSLPILGKGLIEQAMRVRKNKPIFMVDLAVPRDIEPEVEQLHNVYLYSVDDLKHVVDESLTSRKIAAIDAKKFIDLQVVNYMRKLRSLDAVATICDYRKKVSSLRDSELNKAKAQLRNGKDAEQILQQMAHNLTNKIMHEPTVTMRKAGSEGQLEILAMVKKLFGLSKS